MVKTQIQLPDEMYRAAKELAASREWSLAELIRRGVEQVLCCFPERIDSGKKWELPDPRPLGADAFFQNPDWRFMAHHPEEMVRESPPAYEGVKKKREKKK